MTKNIVVATDFSQRSFEIINRVLSFAKSDNDTVHVVHILENNFPDVTKNNDLIYENCFLHIQEEVPLLLRENFHCREDSLENGIEEYVKELKASLVIIGSSGERSSILKDLLGTSTKSIVRSVDVPCFVLKSNKEVFDFESILIPSDLSDKSKKYINDIHTFFPNANIEILHSYLVPFERRLSFYGMDKTETHSFQESIKNITIENVNGFYESLNIDKRKVKISIINEGLSPEAFSLYALEKKCDMIALHTSGVFSFFAFDLLEHSHQDVLITKI